MLFCAIADLAPPIMSILAVTIDHYYFSVGPYKLGPKVTFKTSISELYILSRIITILSWCPFYHLL